VTIIGLGPMGQAMARAFLAAGHPVTVWNRTASRADALVAEGAPRAATPAEALAASRLVILSAGGGGDPEEARLRGGGGFRSAFRGTRAPTRPSA
jgi:3-hydroxyisobutyrate dehydrogenase-like beta-hydroxyacid dehydrogenase